MKNDEKKAEALSIAYPSWYANPARAFPFDSGFEAGFDAGYDHAKSETQAVRDAATNLVVKLDELRERGYCSCEIGELDELTTFKTALSDLDSKEK